MSALGMGHDHAVMVITYVGGKLMGSIYRSFFTCASSLRSVPRVPTHVTNGSALYWLFQSLKPLSNL